MIRIILVKSSKASLPEIDAYVEYFNAEKDFSAKKIDYRELEQLSEDSFDVIWFFMGKNKLKFPGKVLIHEYASVSTGKLAKAKNKLKKLLTTKPDIRIFLNSKVRSEMSFNDNVPYLYRDMGISPYKNKKNIVKKNQYVYVGDVNNQRDITKVLDQFTKDSTKDLLLIGNYSQDIYNEYVKYTNIKFLGYLPHREVQKILSESKYGLNYIPNVYPYNFQTSTKLLEYLYNNLNIITTDYQWVNDFERKYNCKFYRLDQGENSKLNFSEVESYSYKGIKDMEDFYWSNILRHSGIKEKIIEQYNAKKKEL